MWGTFRLVFSYLRVLVGSLLIPLALWYVLGRIADRSEVLIISIGGILYAILNQIFVFFKDLNHKYAKGLEERLVAIQMIVDESAKDIGVGDRLKMLYRQEALEFHSNIQSLLMSAIAVVFMIYCLVRILTVT